MPDYAACKNEKCEKREMYATPGCCGPWGNLGVNFSLGEVLRVCSLVENTWNRENMRAEELEK